ncbi:PadR family transcriptional regulator [Devosia sp.]|uniref:PadR family transcriptional regulator n=1 Tax=Devosia sp. TaxID=1871048 RepID=UPI003A912285
MRDEDDHRWDRWESQWRRMEGMARRGFRNFSNIDLNFDTSKMSNFMGLGGNLRIGRMLASGDLRLVALYLIEQQPRHGYDIIKAVEERSMGFYSPSPGIVYPALTFLEEAGYVTSATEGNKKLYTITDTGRTHLDDNREAIDSTLDFLGKAGSRMNDWRDRMSQPGWPFNSGEDDGGRDGEAGQGAGMYGHTDVEYEDHYTSARPSEPPRQDARGDGEDLDPDVKAARKALKKAIRQAVSEDPGAQRRVAAILRRAAADIRQDSNGR